MSRSGYSDDVDDWWQHIMWRGAVASAFKGKRGQAFLKEMLDALDALPEKKLIADKLEAGGAVCVIGAVGRARGTDMSALNPENYHKVAAAFGVARAMVQEIVFMNDEIIYWKERPEQRYARMRQWIESQIRDHEGGHAD